MDDAYDLPFKPAGVNDPERTYFSGCGPRDPPPRARDSSAEKLERMKAADAAAVSLASSGSVIASCPRMRRHALEVTVVDAEGQPLEDVLVELRKSPTEALVARTDAGGALRFQGLMPGKYQLGLPSLDEDRWEVLGGTSLPEDRDACFSEAAWKAPPPPEKAEPTTHTVEQGECISTLAHRHGLLADTLWDLPANAGLKRQRGNRNILLPGDKVVIPPKRLALRDVEASVAYRIRRKDSAEQLRIRFLDRKSQPRAGESYLLTVVGPSGTEERTGKTDGSGFMLETVPASTREVQVVMGQGDAQETFVFRAAHLDPLDTLSGVQGRLTNLGYPCDKDEGKLGAFTRRALRDFQRDHGLTVTGEPDTTTLAAIEEQHLS